MNPSTNGGTPDEQMMYEAVSVANVPTLLMVLVQLTGELRWLDEPYRVVRQHGMGDNDSGGLPEEVQQEVREAALEAMLAWKAGRPVAVPEPSEELLVRMLTTAMGEEVPPEYGGFTAAQLGQVKFLDHEPYDLPADFRVLIIGAGVSGLCAAINLQMAGIPFTVVERNPTVGGVWLENKYPGAGVDTPNHLYSYSFATYDWEQYFCLRDELWGYLEHVSREFDVRQHIRFDTTVDRVVYDAEHQCWHAEITNPGGTAETLDATIVISGAGMFNPPVVPDIEGLDSWTGECWHTARWPDDASLAGKRVAIIGNGASCMQIAPEVQHEVESLTIYQRSTQWAVPFERFRTDVPDALRWLLREVPLYQRWYRVRLGWTFNDRIHSSIQIDPDWDHPERSLNRQNESHRGFLTGYIADELGERCEELLAKVLPTYPPFGKRMLMDNGWFRMLRNRAVELVTDPIERIDGDRVVTVRGDGDEPNDEAGDEVAREADVLVLATGFDVARVLNTFEVVGKSGVTLREVWEDDNARAYLGTTVPDFPNLFVLYGPNLQPGHGGSLIMSIEMQVRYIMELLREMSETGMGAIEVRPDVYERYNAAVDEAHSRMVWSHPGMSTYYRNDRGRIVVTTPYRNVDYYEMTRDADLDDYVFEPSADVTAAPAT
jgi:4-hydroxyacetophenone monooxygenase